MGIGDAIHDNILELIESLRLYDEYIYTRKEIVVELLASMYFAVYLSDTIGLPDDSYIQRDKQFFITYARMKYEEEFEKKYEDY